MSWEKRWRGAAPPPSGGPRWFPIVRGSHGDPVVYVVLSHVLTGFWTHWMLANVPGGGRTKPCYSPDACEGCELKAGLNHYSFLPAMRVGRKERVVLMLPATAANQVLAMRPERLTLRGLRVGVQKTGPQRQDAVAVVCEGDEPEREVPQPHPIADSLRHLWKVASLPGEGVVAGRIGGAS